MSQPGPAAAKLLLETGDGGMPAGEAVWSSRHAGICRCGGDIIDAIQLYQSRYRLSSFDLEATQVAAAAARIGSGGPGGRPDYVCTRLLDKAHGRRRWPTV